MEEIDLVPHTSKAPSASQSDPLGGNVKGLAEQVDSFVGPQEEAVFASPAVLSKSRSYVVIILLSLVLFINSAVSGFVTVGLPRMSSDLALPTNLLLWPQSVYGLTSGSCLLLAGAVADVLGSRHVNLVGNFLLGIFIVACGVSSTGLQLVLFRAMQGIAIALVMPTGLGIISTAIAAGTRRNTAFSCLGIGQLLGYAMGLVISGVLVDTVGWRVGFYISGSLMLAVGCAAVWALPKDHSVRRPSMKRLRNEIDWLGAVLASACLSIVSYVLA